jgi:hypothetical protein
LQVRGNVGNQLGGDVVVAAAVDRALVFCAGVAMFRLVLPRRTNIATGSPACPGGVFYFAHLLCGLDRTAVALGDLRLKPSVDLFLAPGVFGRAQLNGLRKPARGPQPPYLTFAVFDAALTQVVVVQEPRHSDILRA